MSGLYGIAVTNAVMSGKKARFEAEAAEARLRPHAIRARSLLGSVRFLAKPQAQTTPVCCAA